MAPIRQKLRSLVESTPNEYGIVSLLVNAGLLVGLVGALYVAAGVRGAPTSTTATVAQTAVTPTATRQLPTAVALHQFGVDGSASLADAIPTAEVLHIADTGGQSVYMRRTPDNGDRVRAYAAGTEVQLIGADVEASGIRWRHVQAPDGITGYVPADNVAP